jgi:5-methylthioadenosine/S-adenosylhomocysteine deaminase
MTTTVIRNADWVVGWNKAKQRHAYLRGADVVFAGDRLTFVGRGYQGEAGREIDGRRRMVMPGLVNIHAHPSREPLHKGLMEERGSPQFANTSLYEYLGLLRPDADTTRAAALFAVAELLKSGVTTMVDYSAPRPSWFEDMASSGVRAYLAPAYRSARWTMPTRHRVAYEWDEKAGEDAMAQALDIVDRATAHESGRLFGMLAPAQVDTCTEQLLLRSADEAQKRGIPVQTHAAQSVVEFREMTTRHGTTPIGWLHDIGFLRRGAILAHCIYIDAHSWIRWPYEGDLARLAESGTAVAHCPTVFARRGVVLQHFGKYRKLGIEVGLGTDTFPHNFIDEMRWVAVICKVSAGSVEATSLGEIFHAATVGGARALLRDDIGRLEAGCRADLALVDLDHPSMQPMRDPLASLVFSGLERPITDVFVDGRRVVAEGRVTTVDLAAVAEAMNRGQAEALEHVPEFDPQRRPTERVFPMTLESVP